MPIKLRPGDRVLIPEGQEVAVLALEDRLGADQETLETVVVVDLGGPVGKYPPAMLREVAAPADVVGPVATRGAARAPRKEGA